jgi:hypothetical protein
MILIGQVGFSTSTSRDALTARRTHHYQSAAPKLQETIGTLEARLALLRPDENALA